MKLAATLRNLFLTVLELVLLFGMSSAGAQTQTPSPALLVLDKEDNMLSIIDPGTTKTVARIPTGEGPHEIAVSDDGKFAFVANYGARTPGNSLSVMDLMAQKEQRRVDLGALRRPHGIEFAEGKVWFTAEENKLIARYDPASNQIDWLLGIGQNRTHMLVFSKDHSQIFTSNIQSDSITLLQRSSDPYGWSATNIAVGKGPEGGDLSPDGREYWAANSNDGTISIIDVAAKKVTQTIDIRTGHSNRLEFTPDGKLVLISDPGNHALVILDAGSRRELKRLNPGRQPLGILVVPDGSRAYVAVAGDNAVAVVDLKTLEVTGHITTGKGPDGMVWAQRK
ncbi:MAG TPA: cytochrome D1 domain-containing protein [Candidatus Acidoferrum sp.]|nr:cytochrome D1 domain-containing protein [Candidatus Acidoferrum sp.]